MFRQPGPSFLHISRRLKQQLTHLLLYFWQAEIKAERWSSCFGTKGSFLPARHVSSRIRPQKHGRRRAGSCCQPDIFGLDGLLHSWFVCAEPPAHPVNVSSLQLDRKWHLVWSLSFTAASCARCSNEVVQQKEKWGGVRPAPFQVSNGKAAAMRAVFMNTYVQPIRQDRGDATAGE